MTRTADWLRCLFLAMYERNPVTHRAQWTLGAAFYLPTSVVPPVVIAHIMSFWLLLTKDPSKGVNT